jgi:hypothetical protein
LKGSWITWYLHILTLWWRLRFLTSWQLMIHTLSSQGLQITEQSTLRMITKANDENDSFISMCIAPMTKRGRLSGDFRKHIKIWQINSTKVIFYKVYNSLFLQITKAFVSQNYQIQLGITKPSSKDIYVRATVIFYYDC